VEEEEHEGRKRRQEEGDEEAGGGGRMRRQKLCGFTLPTPDPVCRGINNSQMKMKNGSQPCSAIDLCLDQWATKKAQNRR
jgi:hypothetical protein